MAEVWSSEAMGERKDRETEGREKMGIEVRGYREETLETVKV